MNIDILAEPNNKTKFNRGDKVRPTKESGATFLNGDALVVGEGHSYLHLFSIKTGEYYGIFKAPPNLSVLEVIK